MNINRQKAWRTEQIAASEIAKYDKGSQIEEVNENRCFDFLVTSLQKGMQYGVEIKRSEFARTKSYADYLDKLQQRQNEINFPILLVSINESSEEVKIGIVLSWFHRRPSITRDIVLWNSTQENWDKALNLLSISAHVEGPIEFLQMDNLYVKKSMMLSVERHDERRYLAELVYMRKMSPDYKMNPIERNTLQEEMQFYLRGYDREEYPSDSLDNAIYNAIHDKFNEATINNKLIVLNTELRDLQVYREYNRGLVRVHIAPRLDEMNEAALRLIGQHTEFSITLELYAHSIEDKNYFHNMDFYYQERADDWVGKVIEYRNVIAGYKKLSDIIG